MADYEPYPDADCETYRFTGGDLNVPYPGEGRPRRQHVETGATVALPDHVADGLSDVLEPLDASDDEAAPTPTEDDEPDSEPTEAAYDIPDDETLDGWTYDQVRGLASETPVDARQGHDEMVADLRTLRDEGEEALG